MTEDHNIWQDPDAAATVRRHANGNETVPTVTVGDGNDTIAMVNPSITAVIEALNTHKAKHNPAPSVDND